METANGRVFAVRGIATGKLTALADHPERLLYDRLRRPVKWSHSSEVVETTIDVSGVPTSVVLKRCGYKSRFKAFLGRFRRSRALAAWQRGHALLARGIPTARPLVVSEPRGGWFARDSYLVTERIAGAVDLHEYARRLASRTTPDRERRVRQLAQSVGTLIGRMHAAGLSHRDLKANNLIVVERAGSVDVLMIDLDGLRVRRTVGPATRSRDLGRLATSAEAHRWLTRTARLRLLRSYLAQFPLESREWKPLWRQIAGHVRVRTARFRYNGLPVA
jgi:tRNA A-37 threonylcarbamoyl transferase component Bud32